jgi:hypothetical protein
MAAPVLTAVPSTSRLNVSLIVQADAGTKVTIFRVADGAKTAVRRGTNVDAGAGLQIKVTDYEIPQGTALEYYAVSTVGGVETEGNHVKVPAIDFGRDVLFDLGKPKFIQKVYVESFTPMEHDIQREVINVWDRTDPVVVSGIRQMPSGQLNLITLELSERKALLNTLRSGNVIAFSQRKPTYGLDPIMYFSVGRVTESRPSPLAEEAARKWSLEVQQIAQPSSTYVFPDHGKTWQTVKDDGTKWDGARTGTWGEFEGL